MIGAAVAAGRKSEIPGSRWIGRSGKLQQGISTSPPDKVDYRGQCQNAGQIINRRLLVEPCSSWDESEIAQDVKLDSRKRKRRTEIDTSSSTDSSRFHADDALNGSAVTDARAGEGKGAECGGTRRAGHTHD
ncbi:hypothetical protein ANO11243_010720 [Dothideomycetidae sp. 11243]|nr:hypothetical protein ANO11243_010720 [fungal sp. No.11243]